MRDYNQIKFKSPRKVKDHPLVVVEDEKKEGSSTTVGSSSAATSQTAPSTPPVPSSSLTQRKQPQSQANKLQHYNQYGPPRSNSNNNNKRGTSAATTPPMSAQDALAVRKEGAEATIVRLRSALEESSHKDTTAKAALAKSDAVIFELKSSVRQLKRQLEKVQQEKDELAARGVPHPPQADARSAADASLDARVGELQVQLDRAHAQIITADMVRKELEDTLEAEQYTWELRVQDQERQIQELQQDCAALVSDLEAVRKDWKDADAAWQRQVDELTAQLQAAQADATARGRPLTPSSDNDESKRLKEKLRNLESERAELQGCLDEALKELEAVDAELQGDPVQHLREENERLHRALEASSKQRAVGGTAADASLTEPLQHLYRLLLERDGLEASASASPNDSRALLAAIQAHIDSSPPPNASLQETRQQVRSLEAQLSVYKGDLQAREESTAELRASLKEAVSLLKPLQDAVAKADKEKQALQRQIQEYKDSPNDGESTHQLKELQDELDLKEKEIERLREEVQTLELALTRAKAEAASSAAASLKVTSPESSVDSSSRARRLRQKRAEEDQIRQMLKDAQSRFHNLHEQNQEATARNLDLQNRLDGGETEDQQGIDHEALQELQDELKIARGELSAKEVEMRQLQKDLEAERYKRGQLGEDDAVALREARSRVDFLERKLEAISSELKSKKESERALNGSLKEALTLLRPMQRHLEEAEREKKEMAKELTALKRRGGAAAARGGNGKSESETNQQHVRDLEYTVQQLEKENTQLHDALEEMSQSINASHLSGGTNLSGKNESKLREDLVEMKSRYEVTQSRLEDAFVENHTLVEALRKREKEEKEMVEELHVLRQKLKQSQAQLERTRSRSFGGGSSTYSGHSHSSRERMDRPKTPEVQNTYGATQNSPRFAQKRSPSYWD
jgi:chromosome segregation ATPase